ncbi:hypothetical protein Tco_1282858 [Tanacetum coccineum]
MRDGTQAKDLLQQHVKHAKKVRARQEGNSECDSSETNKAETLARISVNEGSSSDWHSAFHISLMAKDLWSLLAKWWELDIPFCSNISDWYDWLDDACVAANIRLVLEGGGLLCGLFGVFRII